jgi:hypothetical protein
MLGMVAAMWSVLASAHDCVAAGGYAQCSDGTTYTYQGGATVGSDGTTIIRTPSGVYVGHQHPGGVQYAPTRDPRLGDEAHPGCKKVKGREVCG